MPVLRLAIPTPLRTLFDYLPPEGQEDSHWEPGQRLRVPFGRRELTGTLLEIASKSEFGDLKRASERLDDRGLLPPALLELCRWAANYYLHPPGEVLSAVFPRSLRDGGTHQGIAEPGWRLSTRGKGLPEGALSRAPKQAAALALLQSAPAIGRDTLDEHGISRSIIRALQDKGLVEACTLAHEPRQAKAREGLNLTPEQSQVLSGVASALGQFQCHLLEGVTGSGKTEVYLQLIARCLADGKQAMVLIPEIGLTPQTLARFEARFEAQIAVLHSGLGDAQRYRAWESARSGSADIIIGTRSAVFTPLARPGLIIVDEEHDSSFKQQDGFRYSARDVAIKRAQLEGTPVLLGSATPSLESLHNALGGRYMHHRLTHRATGSSLPRVEVADLRRQPLEAGISQPVLESIRETLAGGGQCLLFLNRRGFAPTLQCHDCGWLAACEHCDARLTLHRRQRRLRCHHCGFSQQVPDACPDCHSPQLLTQGLGTEQAEDSLRRHFPGTPLFRVDSDSMQGREAMQALVDQVNGGEPCILLGTQMLTKGHHFPGVALVAVIDMDAMLFSTDFRGEERAAQLLTQVSGRAGRADREGRVILQTHHPEHTTLQSMVANDYHQLAHLLLEDRQARQLPPFGSLALLRSDCVDAQRGEEFLAKLRHWARGQVPETVQLIGPLPAPMQRRAGRFRSQLLLHSPDRRSLHHAAHLLVDRAQQQKGGGHLNWSVDIDPQDLF